MKLTNLNPGDTFLSDSGIEFQVLLMNKSEERHHKKMVKVRRLDTGEIFYFSEMIVRKIK